MNRFVAAILLLLLTSSLLIAQQTAIYPLHVGNRWEFTLNVLPGPYVFISNVVRDTMMPNSMIYADVRQEIYSSHIFLRQSGNRILSLSPGSTSEIARYDFGIGVHDTVVSIPGNRDALDVILAAAGTAYLFGANRFQWTFRFHHRHIMDADETHVITEGIGATFVGQAFGEFMLRGAVIRGIVYGTVDVRPNTGVAPLAFDLQQNYPNPFNLATTINYRVSTINHVTLKVVDILGRDVATLVDGVGEPGSKSVQWDAKEVASGVYFCRLQAGNYLDARKMVLSK